MLPSDFVGVRPEVQWFSNEMERKLLENDHKSHWSGFTNRQLLNRLKQETAELEHAIGCGKDVVGEAADVANFAMMIADIFSEQNGSLAAFEDTKVIG